MLASFLPLGVRSAPVRVRGAWQLHPPRCRQRLTGGRSNTPYLVPPLGNLWQQLALHGRAPVLQLPLGCTRGWPLWVAVAQGGCSNCSVHAARWEWLG